MSADFLSAIDSVSERNLFSDELGDSLVPEVSNLNGKWYAALCFDIGGPTPSSSATIEDGFIMNATVRVRDVVTLQTRGIFVSDSGGSISIPQDWGLVAIDVIDSINGEQAVDISTNEPFTGTLSAISDPSSGSDIAVTPLTSLVTSSVVEAIESSISLGTPMLLSDVSNLKSTKLNQVATAFGVSVDDLEKSPINTSNDATAKIAMQISIVEKMISSVSSESGVDKKDATRNFMNSLMSQIESKEEGGTLDLTDSTELSTLVDTTSSRSGITIETTKLNRLKSGVKNFTDAVKNITTTGNGGLEDLAKINKVATQASNAGGVQLETMLDKEITEIESEANSAEIFQITNSNDNTVSMSPVHEQALLAHFDGSVANNELVDVKSGTYNASYRGFSTLIHQRDELYGLYVPFNGTDQYYELNTGFTSEQITDKITFSCLIKPRSTGDWQGIFTNTPGSNTGLSFALNSYYRYWFQIYPGAHTYNLEGGYTLNEWHVFSVVYDGSTVKAYKDLTELIVKEQTGNLTFFDNTPWYIGAWGHYPPGRFNGLLARMMIFNDAIPIDNLYAYMTEVQETVTTVTTGQTNMLYDFGGFTTNTAAQAYLTDNNFTSSYGYFNYGGEGAFVPNSSDGFAFLHGSSSIGYISKILPAEGGTWVITYGSQFPQYDPTEILLDDSIVDSTNDQSKSFTLNFNGGETLTIREVKGGAIIYNIQQ